MKQTITPVRTICLFIGAGCAGFLLRMILYMTGTDSRGLLVRRHWALIALMLVTVAAIAAAVYLSRTLHGPQHYRAAFPVSLPAALGALLAAVTVLLASVSCLHGDRAERLCAILGFAAAASLLLTAYCRMCGIRPFFLLHVCISVYFALTMVLRYRMFSADPQLMDYCFALCAYALLMLAAYHHAAMDAGSGSYRALWLTSLLAAFLCCTAAYGASDAPVLLAAAVWVLTGLPATGEKARRRRSAFESEKERPADETA